MRKGKVVNIEKNRIILIILMIFSFGFHLVDGSNIYTYIGISILAILIFSGNETDDFYTYLSLIPYFGGVKIFDRNILFIFLFVSILKLLLKNKLQFRILFSALLFVGIELINDIFYAKIGIFLLVFSSILYYVFFSLCYEFREYSYRKATNILIITSLSVIVIAFIISNGNLISFASDNSLNRFGEEVRELGGAMGLPIYCLLAITLIVQKLVLYKMVVLNKVIFIFLIVSIALVGFLTLSRVYILGLVTFIICLCLSLFMKKRSKIVRFLILVIIIAMITVANYPEYINNIIEKIIQRSTAGDFSTGRIDIYYDCYRYLISNPLALFIGEGNINYINIGKNEGYLFGIMAHNLYLDAIMSWGIIGTISFINLTYFFSNKCKRIFNTKNNIISAAPLIVWLTCSMTGGSFYYFKTYMYILILLINMYAANSSIK